MKNFTNPHPLESVHPKKRRTGWFVAAILISLLGLALFRYFGPERVQATAANAIAWESSYDTASRSPPRRTKKSSSAFPPNGARRAGS